MLLANVLSCSSFDLIVVCAVMGGQDNGYVTGTACWSASRAVDG